jgi:hydrogenase expression/formation protein HypC
MCIGIPLQVTALEPGHAVCDDHGTPRRVRTALVGDGLQPGDWLLVFIDSAVELLAPERAAEINHTLALLGEALADHRAADADAGFDLPSRWSAAELQALTGAASTGTQLETL